MQTRIKSTSPIFFLLLLLLVILVSSLTEQILRPVYAAQRRIHIEDDLDDVVDDEEDESWKQWGRRRSSQSQEEEFDPPPDFTNMDLGRAQEEMMKRHFGPTFGFVKLRLGVPRTRDMVSEIAMKWTKVLKTGGVEAKFMGVDLSTVMFTMNKGQDTLELKAFLLEQPDAYEVKIGDQVFRRPGDPPLEEVVEELRRKETDEPEQTADEDEVRSKEEL